ncbi:hypothetical protein [Shewanella kaireitica]|uniref:hypothetical protein n=1 Tax=Shewanella kaireitica TaxID=212021 RepID=UPI00200F7B89|nr:hypothetical protein [Shewanella kaireitica]MCL1096305.1 hypothetical protein [Shewanella kaireitica]
MSNVILATAGHKFKNPNWSWGSINHETKSVILRIWENEIIDVNGEQCAEVLNPLYSVNINGRKRAGYTERSEHFECILQGYKPYFLVCTPEDGNAEVWSINSHRKELVIGNHGIFSMNRINDVWYSKLTNLTIKPESL